MHFPLRSIGLQQDAPPTAISYTPEKAVDLGGFALRMYGLAPQQRGEFDTGPTPRILIVLLGEVLDDLRLDQRSYGERCVAFLPAHLRGTRIAGAEGVRLLEIEMDPQRLLALGIRGVMFERVRQFEGGELAVLALRLQRELHCLDEQSPIAMQGILLELLSRAGREMLHQRGTRTPLCLARAENFIAQHFHEPIQLHHVAEVAGVHQVYLARVFRRFRHLSVGDAIRRRRVEYVIERLDSSEEALADLAIAAGFADQSHLTRIFKQQTGVTPARYRSARQQLRASPARS